MSNFRKIQNSEKWEKMTVNVNIKMASSVTDKIKEFATGENITVSEYIRQLCEKDIKNKVSVAY